MIMGVYRHNTTDLQLQRDSSMSRTRSRPRWGTVPGVHNVTSEQWRRAALKPYDVAMSRDAAPTLFSVPPLAFSRFVEERRDGLVRFATGLGISSDDAKDLVQEGFMRLMRYCDRTPVNEWTPLIYRIVLNLHRDRQRQRASQGMPMADSEETLLTHPSTVASPERQASDRQQLALARAAILGLPPKCREVYLLNRMDGLSYSAIALRCGISLKTVEKHISRALGELRQKVDRDLSQREDF